MPSQTKQQGIFTIAAAIMVLASAGLMIATLNQYSRAEKRASQLRDVDNAAMAAADTMASAGDTQAVANWIMLGLYGIDGMVALGFGGAGIGLISTVVGIPDGLSMLAKGWNTITKIQKVNGYVDYAAQTIGTVLPATGLYMNMGAGIIPIPPAPAIPQYLGGETTGGPDLCGAGSSASNDADNNSMRHLQWQYPAVYANIFGAIGVAVGGGADGGIIDAGIDQAQAKVLEQIYFVADRFSAKTLDSTEAWITKTDAIIDRALPGISQTSIATILQSSDSRSAKQEKIKQNLSAKLGAINEIQTVLQPLQKLLASQATLLQGAVPADSMEARQLADELAVIGDALPSALPQKNDLIAQVQSLAADASRARSVDIDAVNQAVSDLTSSYDAMREKLKTAIRSLVNRIRSMPDQVVNEIVALVSKPIAKAADKAKEAAQSARNQLCARMQDIVADSESDVGGIPWPAPSLRSPTFQRDAAISYIKLPTAELPTLAMAEATVIAPQGRMNIRQGHYAQLTQVRRLQDVLGQTVDSAPLLRYVMFGR